MTSSSSSSSGNIICCTVFLCCIVVQLVQVTAIKLPPNVRVPAVLVFGDSIVDPGNNNHLPSIIKANFAPYGRDFQGGPSGRFSNGLIPSDMIVSAFGIRDTLPAYLDPSLEPNDLLTGVSFASGGAGYDPLTAKLVGVLGLPKQMEYFKEYLTKVEAAAGQDKAKSIISESVYLIVAGSDDLANTYFALHARPHHDIPAYTDLMVQGATNLVQELYDMGARRFAVLSAPPIGCVPSQRTLGGGKKRNCAEKYNQAAQMFNSKLSSSLENLNANKIKHGRAVFVDIYNPLQDIINRPGHYGFVEASKGCCGTGLIETVILCTELSPFTCDDVSNYIFWDSYHPTEKAYKSLVDPVLKKYLNQFFCNSGTVC